MKYTMFTRRTNDPKLAWLERRLDEMGIAHRRNGESFHAPILEVDESKIDKAGAFLSSPFDEDMSVDDVPDDDPIFLEE